MVVRKKMLPMKKCVFVLLCLGVWAGLAAQTISEQEAVERALKNYPSVQLADLETRQRKALERTAFNPSQPQVAVETPADVGVGVEIQQQFDFPSVYGRRSKWLKSQTRLASETANLTRSELKREVRLAYLEAQSAQAQVRFLARQDSLWQGIAGSSRRLFDGGQINKADLLFAERQAGLLGINLAQARTDAANALAVLALFTGGMAAQVEDFQALPFVQADTASSFYFEKYLSEAQQTAQSEIAVRQAERLPGLTLGYLRVPDLDTEFRYRFRAGVTVPIWQGQYKGEIEAAKIALESAQTQAVLRRQQAQATRLQLLQTLAQTSRSLAWFEKTALLQSEDLATTSKRLYEGGEFDYVLMLRNVADAFDVQNQYLETLRRHNQAVVELEFLSGQ